MTTGPSGSAFPSYNPQCILSGKILKNLALHLKFTKEKEAISDIKNNNLKPLFHNSPV